AQEHLVVAARKSLSPSSEAPHAPHAAHCNLRFMRGPRRMTAQTVAADSHAVSLGPSPFEARAAAEAARAPQGDGERLAFCRRQLKCLQRMGGRPCCVCCCFGACFCLGCVGGGLRGGCAAGGGGAATGSATTAGLLQSVSQMS